MMDKWIIPLAASLVLTVAVVVWYGKPNKPLPLGPHTIDKQQEGCVVTYLDRTSSIDGKSYRQTIRSSGCSKSGIMTMTDNNFLYFVVETSDGTKLTYKTTVNEYKKWMEGMKGEWQDAK